MRVYNSPAEMFEARANSFKREADRHWAMAKNGEGDYHYGKAKEFYRQASINRDKASIARDTGMVFGKRK